MCGDLETGCYSQAALEVQPGTEKSKRDYLPEAASGNGSKRRLFLVGGTRGVDGEDVADILEYHEQFGFFHTESYLDEGRGAAIAEFLP